MSSHSDAPIVISRGLLDRLVETVRGRLPEKTFGYFVSDVDERAPTDFVVFAENVRNKPEWQAEFHAYGRYFVDHDDAGFVGAPEEVWRLQQELWAAGLFEVGVFHSHQRHPANFSQIDYEMHVSRFASLWHLIVSMRNPQLPQLRAFDVLADGTRELRLDVIADGAA